MKNRLKHNDCCVTNSQEERNWVLEQLYNNGHHIPDNVWDERNDGEDFNEWPIIIYEGDYISVIRTHNNREWFTASEYLTKAGVDTLLPYKWIKQHHFV